MSFMDRLRVFRFRTFLRSNRLGLRLALGIKGAYLRLAQRPAEQAEFVRCAAEISDHKWIAFWESLCIPIAQLCRANAERRGDF